MTSSNFSEEPIAIDNKDALARLSSLADAFLLHNRDIHVRSDDSVVRVQRGSTIYLRRSRGYAPYPVRLPLEVKPTLAVGGELKNTFCLTHDRYAFLSHHIGDMENTETYTSFEQGVRHLSHIFHVQPEVLAHDLHPDYFTTHYAEQMAIPRIGIQHHHAHIASCMVDNGLNDRRVIGLAFDGSGYGADGARWGGEVLLASYADFERFAHLEYLPLLGGDSAIPSPWRIMADMLLLSASGGHLPFLQIDKQALRTLREQIDTKANIHLIILGRLDAVANLVFM
jgi:hydrogenase maturation protein HypF